MIDSKRLAESIATSFGMMLQQEYMVHDGEWWLFTRGKAQRQLKPDEVSWHVARNHKPFVRDGIDKDHPDWWKDPPEGERP